MKISKDKVVAISYELIVDGKTADKADETRPLEYIQGNHMLLPKFEAELEGREPGDDFAFTLSPEEGYGVVNPEMIISLPKSAFTVNGRVMEELLVPGTVIPMLNGQGGVVQGTVHEVRPDTVMMDFNHPMAGKTLNFSGRVLSVREATPKELAQGLHGEFLPPEEGCKGGCHGGGGCCHDGEGGHCDHHGEGSCSDSGHKEGNCCHSGGCK